MKSVDIWKLRKGMCLQFTGENGRELERERAKEIMQIGCSYMLSDFEIHDWHTTLYFDEFPGVEFNSVMFKSYDKGENN